MPPGAYLTGAIYLKSRVTLYIENGATLLGSTEMADYPENPPPRPNHDLEFGRYALIHAEGAEDVAIVGQGRICGQGNHTNFTKKDLLWVAKTSSGAEFVDRSGSWTKLVGSENLIGRRIRCSAGCMTATHVRRHDPRRSGNCPQSSPSEQRRPAAAPVVSPQVICPAVSRPSVR